MSHGYEKLRQMTDDELTRALDDVHRDPQALLFYIELHHRDAQRQGDHMLRLTRTITLLTVVMAVLTAVNVALVVWVALR
jgi:hypothetical protein